MSAVFGCSRRCSWKAGNLTWTIKHETTYHTSEDSVRLLGLDYTFRQEKMVERNKSRSGG